MPHGNKVCHFVALLGLVTSCSAELDPNSPTPCEEGLRRCANSSTIEVCEAGSWRTSATCEGSLCAAGECQGCSPSCEGRQCGDDGCGGSCGDCLPPTYCGDQGACTDPPPGCGDDDCGAGETCRSCPSDCGLCPSACTTLEPVALAACVDRERYLDDLELVAGERTPSSSHWLEVQSRCASELGALGFEVSLERYGTGVNVVGVLEGTERPDEQVILGAHYDHIDGCEGADDNASGVAGVLEAARVLAPTAPPRTLVAVCFDEEEDGLIGSFAYARAANQRGDRVAAFYNFEMIGYASDEPDSQGFPAEMASAFPELAAEVEANDSRGDFILVLNDELASEAARALERHLEETAGVSALRIELPASALFDYSDLLRSDHASFWAYAYPAVSVDDTAEFRNPYYHCAAGQDSVDTLDLDFAVGVVRGMVAAAAETLLDTTLPSRPPALSCTRLCQTISTTEQLDCAIEVLGMAGIDVGSAAGCSEASTPQECEACATSLDLLDGDCAMLGHYCL